MGNQKFFDIIGILFSILIYLLIFLVIAYYIHEQKDKKKDYGFNIEDAIVVDLESIPDDKPSPKLEPILAPQTPPQTKPQEESEAKESVATKKQESRDKEKKSVKDLFNDLPTDKLKEQMKKHEKELAIRESRLKKQKELEKQRAAKIAEQIRKRREANKASQAVEKLNITPASSSQKSGEYDDFWSSISNKIMAAWQRTLSTQDGLKANVKIRIDKHGRLTYKIINLSNNNLFDTKLKAFLDNLTYERFKAYDKGPFIEAVFEFKDKERGI